MEADESVPLTFERHAAPVPDEFRLTERRAEVASVIDITGLIGDLEAGRRASGGG